MDLGGECTRELLGGDEPLELSFVELVVAASDCSEDESELFDLVDGLLESGRVRLSNPSDGDFALPERRETSAAPI